MILTQTTWFSQLFEDNHKMIQMQVKDVTQAESLLQLLFKGNCLNWVVGHILDTYSTCLEWMGQPAIRSEAEASTYGYGSQPMTDPARAYDLSDMLKRLDLAAKQIPATLDGLAPVELEREIELWLGNVPLVEALFYMLCHVYYHTGQLEQLRELAGKNE